jgi:hypothetical protein
MPPKPTADHVLNRTVTGVLTIGEHRLWLRFDDGSEGELDLRTYVPFVNLFAAFEDPRFVAQVRLTERGTIEWPNDVEFDPVVLYCTVTGTPIPTFDAPARKRPRSRGRTATKRPARKFPRGRSRKPRR